MKHFIIRFRILETQTVNGITYHADAVLYGETDERMTWVDFPCSDNCVHSFRIGADVDPNAVVLPTLEDSPRIIEFSQLSSYLSKS